MYFADFKSFTDAQAGAKSFVVEVDLVDGTKEVGSAVPAEVYSQVMLDIATCDELKTMFALWTRVVGGSLIFIPYDKIKTIRVHFAP